MSTIKLSKLERSDLRKLHKIENNRKTADRIKAILLLDSGWTYTQIAEILLLDDQTIRNYEKYYLESKLDGLLTFDYKGGISAGLLKRKKMN
jgi:DNA-binding NarL/FixJ family response regulator